MACCEQCAWLCSVLRSFLAILPSAILEVEGAPRAIGKLRPLLRPMTAEEIAARASRSKVQIKKTSVKCGVGAALDLREQKLEAEGKESTIGRKKKN